MFCINPLKRFAAAALAAMMLAPAAVGAAEVSYWDLTADYYAAEASGDRKAFFDACVKIVEFYEPWDTLEGCERAFPPALKAAAYCEEIGDYDGARTYYTIYRDCLAYIDANTDINYYDAVRCADAMVAQYAFTEPVVYTAAAYPADVPYYGETGEPLGGTYAGMCDTFDEKLSNAYLLYAHFGTEEPADFAWMLPETDEAYLLEIAWNIPDETKKELSDVAAGKYDEYIIRSLRWMDSLEATVLIRFAAEVNTWTSLPQTADEAALAKYAETYIAAFRRVAELARRYAPDAAMVYSPNDISNWYADPTDFYPGDEYVDWVGTSSYMNQGIGAAGTLGSFSDAYYCFGMYDNQMVKIRRVVEAFGDRKPILISECGFCYKGARSEQSEAYASQKLAEFYSAVNMVYPQVKAILYFNADIDGDRYKLSGSKTVKNAYENAVSENAAIAASLAGECVGYTRLETLAEIRESVTLQLYAAYPGHREMRVTYLYDGGELTVTDTLPYRAEITKKQLTPGEHTLEVRTVCGVTEKQLRYTILVGEDGFVTVRAEAAADPDPSGELYDAIRLCAAEGLLPLREDGSFAGDEAVTGSELAGALARLAEIDHEQYLPEEYTGSADIRTAAAVEWAMEEKLFSFAEEEFDPARAVTETELRTVLYNFCRQQKITLAETGPDTDYRNDSIIPDGARDAVYFVRRTELLHNADTAAYRGPKPVRRENLAYALAMLWEEVHP